MKNMFTFNFLKSLFLKNIYHFLIFGPTLSEDFNDEIETLGKKLDKIEDNISISEWIKFFKSYVEEVQSQSCKGETYINLAILCNMYWKKKNFPQRIKTQMETLNSEHAVLSGIGISDDRILDELKTQKDMPFPEIEKKY